MVGIGSHAVSATHGASWHPNREVWVRKLREATRSDFVPKNRHRHVPSPHSASVLPKCRKVPNIQYSSGVICGIPATPLTRRKSLLPARGLKSAMRTFHRIAGCFEKHAFLSYAIILAAAGKTIWGMWIYRDLSAGDTSSYFLKALDWFGQFQVNLLWSPLYTAFYGETLFATHSAYGATNLHRIIIVIAAAIGVLALMRRLMSPGIAMLIALWWTILPINFDTVYEVHLFALLPMLIVLIVASSGTAPLHRGVILALLVGITVLVRNENAVALILFAGFCLVEEVVHPFGREAKTAAWSNGRTVGYAIPLLLVAALIVTFYAHSTTKFSKILGDARTKHTLNACQNYAFGYSQREPGYTANPWFECSALMKEKFGLEEPMLFEMLKANPTATLQHFAWNVGLVPNGFQLALFNGMSGSVNPDYAPARGNQMYAAVLSIVTALVLLAGVWHFRSNWIAIKPKLIAHRHLVAIYACLACVAAVVIMTQRPRPSYLFAFSICIMSLVGLSADLLTKEFTRRVNIAGLMIGVAVLAFLPFYQSSATVSRPFYTLLGHLQPYQPQLTRRGTKLLLGDSYDELFSYLHLETTAAGPAIVRDRGSFSASDYSVLSTWDRREPLEEFLEKTDFDFIFIQPRMLAELGKIPAAANLLDGRSKYTRLNSTLDRDWMLLGRLDDLAPPGLPTVLDQVGWQSEGVYQDGWFAQNGVVEVRAAKAGWLILRGMVPGGIGLDSQHLEITTPTNVRIAKPLVAGPFDMEVPVEAGRTRLTFAFAKAARLPNGDGRNVGALLQSSVVKSR